MGNKPIMITMFVVYGLFGTLIDYTPRYQEFSNHPIVQLSNETFDVLQVSWPSCSSSSSAICTNQTSLFDTGFYDGLTDKLANCKDANGKLLPSIPSYIRPPVLNASQMVVESQDMGNNGSFCGVSWLVDDDHEWTNDVITCDVIDGYGDLPSCDVTVGSHFLTFIIYFLIR